MLQRRREGLKRIIPQVHGFEAGKLLKDIGKSVVNLLPTKLNHSKRFKFRMDSGMVVKPHFLMEI